jgi:MFS superfamily sulfate permease-like transporter
MKIDIKGHLNSLRYDAPASLVVFLVALPLCLGIALSCKVDLLSGFIAGIAGGLVVSVLSKSSLSVTGPAAGLITLVLDYHAKLGTFELLLLAIVIAGGIQVLLGILRLGNIAHFFPVPVILGMLAAIGITLILKQLPYAMGFDPLIAKEQGIAIPESFGTYEAIYYGYLYHTRGAIYACLVSLAILIIWEMSAKLKSFTWLPGALIAVLAGTAVNELFIAAEHHHAIHPGLLVALPSFDSFAELTGALKHPDWSGITNQTVWLAAVTFAMIASLESLLSIEAIDKLDPFKRKTPLNRELFAQGSGNIVSGLLGGLPVTAVIVRSSANLNAGARTRKSTFLHGLMLLVAVLFLAPVLNHIPLSSLAAILLITGYKLAKPKLFISIFKEGWTRFIPFFATIVAVIIEDLLVGIMVGMCIGIFFVLYTNFRTAFNTIKNADGFIIVFNKDVSFLNKAVLAKAFAGIPPGSKLTLNGEKAEFVDPDLVVLIKDYCEAAPRNGITVTIEGFTPEIMKKINSAGSGSLH